MFKDCSCAMCTILSLGKLFTYSNIKMVSTFPGHWKSSVNTRFHLKTIFLQNKGQILLRGRHLKSKWCLLWTIPLSKMLNHEQICTRVFQIHVWILMAQKSHSAIFHHFINGHMIQNQYSIPVVSISYHSTRH